MKALIAVFSLIFPVISQAQEVIGLSALASLSPKFPCSKYLALVRQSPRPGMSVLVGTFGRSPSCVKRYLSQEYDRRHVLLVYLENGPCQNNNRCQPNERPYTHNIRFIRSLEPYMGPNTELWVSPKLEDKNSPGWHRRALTRLRAANLCPGCYAVKYVRNSVKVGPLGDYDLREFHGLHTPSGPRAVVSNDGIEVNLPDVAAWRAKHRDSAGQFLWTGEAQGIGPNSKFIRPLERNFEISDFTIRRWKLLIGSKYASEIN